jgi:hypothetical protein
MVRAFQAAFTEWDRRYREDPTSFMSEVERLLRGTSATYGEACSVYFAKLLDELAAGQPWAAIGLEVIERKAVDVVKVTAADVEERLA